MDSSCAFGAIESERWAPPQWRIYWNEKEIELDEVVKSIYLELSEDLKTEKGGEADGKR
jgi:hypothetical protein